MSSTVISTLDTHDNWQQNVKSTAAALKYVFEHKSGDALWDGCFSLQSSADRAPEVIPVHRLLLAFRSNVFERMFYGSIAETTMPIAVTDITVETFKAMLSYIYQDNIGYIRQSCVLELMYAVHKYDIPDLGERCRAMATANLTFETVLPTLVQYSHEDLLGASVLTSACYDFIDQNTTRVLNSELFLDLSEDLVQSILKRHTLAIDGMPEECLYKALVRWAAANKNNEGPSTAYSGNDLAVVADLIGHIRFSLMSFSDEVQDAKKRGFLSEAESDCILTSGRRGLETTRFITYDRVGRKSALAEIARKSVLHGFERCKPCRGGGEVLRTNRKPFKNPALIRDCPICLGKGEVWKVTNLPVIKDIPCQLCGGRHGLKVETRKGSQIFLNWRT